MPKALTLLTVLALAATPAPFLDRLTVPGPRPEADWVLSHPAHDGVAAYDVALAALWRLDRGELEAAGRLLLGMAALQRDDGALPFSFKPSAPPQATGYVRTGAVAWVAYAAGRWLERARAGTPPPGMAPLVAGLGRGCARYILDRRFRGPRDRRDGLVTGGEGRYVYAREAGRLVERFEPGPVAWVSTEHNVDAWFALRALARGLGEPAWEADARDLGAALVRGLWDDAAGQFHQGAMEAPDPTPALDCASWGAVFLARAGEMARARRALEATRRYAARGGGGVGYRPYRRRALIESRVAYDWYREALPGSDWDEVQAVWPEGTAGVALAALRLGDRAGARRTLDLMAPLRGADGALPGLTLEIPTEFTTRPALAGTAWDALVRSELDGSAAAIRLWGE